MIDVVITPNLVCVVVIISLRDFASRAQRGERDRGGRAVAADPQIADRRRIDYAMMLEL